MIISPVEAQDGDHEVAEDNLRFVANRRVVITAGSYDAEYQLCQVMFSKRDGSIMVALPDLETEGGVLCAVTVPPSHVPGTPLTFSFADGGKATRHVVKFSHHPDGRVHFSQDRKVLTRVKRMAFPLANTLGRIFELHCYRLSGFPRFDHFKRDLRKGHVRTKFTDALPRAVVVTAEWRRKSDMRASIEPAGANAGPKVNVTHRKTGARFMAFWIGQPQDFPLRDHVLQVSVLDTKPLEEITRPTIVFLGGWDAHEVQLGDPPARTTGFLSAIYPARNITEVETLIGSIDLMHPELS